MQNVRSAWIDFRANSVEQITAKFSYLEWEQSNTKDYKSVIIKPLDCNLNALLLDKWTQWKKTKREMLLDSAFKQKKSTKGRWDRAIGRVCNWFVVENSVPSFWVIYLINIQARIGDSTGQAE